MTATFPDAWTLEAAGIDILPALDAILWGWILTCTKCGGPAFPCEQGIWYITQDTHRLTMAYNLCHRCLAGGRAEAFAALHALLTARYGGAG